MTEHEAIEQLAGADVVTYASYGVRYAAEMRDVCLSADIPVALAREELSPADVPEGEDTEGGSTEDKGSAPADRATPSPFPSGAPSKVGLVVRRADVPQVAELLSTEWTTMAAGEGDLDPDLQSAPADSDSNSDSDEPPCPACGTAAPLDDGACSDCGLFLG